MRMPIAGDDNGLPPRPVRHATKSPMGIFVGYIAGMHNVKPLLQVHAGTESLVACTCEDSTSQLGLGVIPLPQCTELYCRFDGEAVTVFGAVDGHLENVFSGEADDAVFDVRIRRFYPAWDGILCSWGRHGKKCSLILDGASNSDHQNISSAVGRPSLKRNKSRRYLSISLSG